MALDTYIRVRCSSAQKKAWTEAAGKQPVSDWARDVLDQAAEAEPEPEYTPEKVVAPRNSTSGSAQCHRAVHHRPGTFCASCGTIPRVKGQ
jgi:hypothetical protein